MLLTGLGLGIVIFNCLVPLSASAQRVTIDGSLSPAKTLTGPNYTIGADLGKQVGGNLFQSFGKFGLNTGETADFTGPATVANIIGRVTGGSTSAIDGKIMSSIQGANLYLINPFGIVFGPHATVNVSGGFHASTADYLKLSDATRFQATTAGGSTFSAAPPAGFGFLNPAPAAITVNGSTLGPVPGTLGLVGGPVTLTGGSLSAPAGTIHIVSAAGTGEVPIDPRQAPSLTGFGPVAVTGGKFDVSDPQGRGSGGGVYVLAGSLALDASEIDADNYGNGSPGQVLLSAAGEADIVDNSAIHSAAIASGGADPIAVSAASLLLDGPKTTISSAAIAGPGGPIVINAGSLTIQNGATIQGSTSGPDSGATISVDVAGALAIDGTAAKSATGILTHSAQSGDAGAIVVTAGKLSISSNGEIITSTTGQGNAGAVTVAAGPITLDGSSAVVPTGVISVTFGNGHSGAITVAASALSITNDALIQSATQSSGNSGDANVTVSNLLSIDGTGTNPKYLSDKLLLPLFLTGISSYSLFGTGDPGNVHVSAGQLTLRNNAVIASATAGATDGRSVAVKVAGAVTIDGSEAQPIPFIPSNIPVFITGISSGSVGTGNGGSVTVSAGSLSLVNGGTITSGSLAGAGNGGTVTVNVAGQLTIDGASQIFLTGILSQTAGSGTAGRIDVTAANVAILDTGGISTNSTGEEGGNGHAGSVTLNADTLSIRSNGQISSGTNGAGDGGDVVVNVTGDLSIDRAGGDPSLLTGITSQSQGPQSGNAGKVSVTAGTLELANGGEIASTSLGPRGKAGDVTIGADAMTLASGAAITTSTLGLGGGRIAISAGTVRIAGGAAIASDTLGVGNGGDIGITASDVELTGPGPLITARSTGGGNAGSIGLVAGRIDIVDGASISTESRSTNGGNITLAAADLLYLRQSSVTTSVKGTSGNGGNIAIDPQLVVLDRSQIIAEAVGGDGGRITIRANSFLASDDSVVSASSQLGVSGTISISGEETGLNGSLFVLPGDLRTQPPVLRDACARQIGRRRSNLSGGGATGVPPDLDMPLSSTYLGAGARPARGGVARLPSLPALTARLAMPCG